MSESTLFFLIAATAAVGMPCLVLGLARGAEPARKKLWRSLFLLAGMALLRFGGEYVLSRLGMGWRCAPRYTMTFLIWVLILFNVFRCMQALELPEEKKTASVWPWLGSFLSLFVSVCLVTLLMVGLSLDRLNESVITVNEQTVVKEGKTNGGVVKRFFLPVNALVHGQELEYDWKTGLITFPDGKRGGPV